MKKFIKNLLAVAFVLGSLVSFGGQAFAVSAPDVISADAINVTSSGATLTGSVNPNGATTSAWFEIQNGAQSSHQNIGGGNSPFSLNSFNANNLAANSNFSFRIVASNAIGNTYSSWVSFTTLPAQQNTTVQLFASSTSITAGQSSVLSWNVTGWTGNCTASASPSSSQWSGTKFWSGSPVTVFPTVTTTYTLTCNGVSDSVTVNVTPVSQPDAPIVSLTANPTSVQAGQSSTLIWSVQNATSCFASGGWSGSKNSNGGSTNVFPNNTTTYTLTCTGPGGSASDSATVMVNQVQNPPVVTLSANPTSVQANGSTMLSWTVANATTCTANSNPATAWTGNKNANGGTQTISNLTTTTFFNIFCTGPGGSDSATVTVTVAQAPAPQVPTVTITAQYPDLAYLGSTDIIWHPSFNATSCIGTGGSAGWAGSKSHFSDSFYAANLTQTVTFTITCSNAAGTSAPASVTVHVAGAPSNNPLVTTNPATNVNNSSATLNGLVNANGNSSVSAWFEWGTNSNLNNQTTENNYGSTSGTNYTYYLSGLTQNTTYYFRAVARAANGQVVYGSTLSFNTTNACTNCNFNLPNVTTYPASNIAENSATLNGFVEPNGSYATRWFEWGTSYSGLYNFTNKVNQGSNSSNVSEQIYGLTPGTTYYYRVAAQNQNGTSYGNVVTFNTTPRFIFDSCLTGSCVPTVATTLATSVTTRSARLNGVAFVNGNAQTQGYFEWGTSTSLGFTTPTVNLGAGQSIPMFSTVSPLSPSTTYYFRAVAVNQYGTARGNILTFRTGTGTVIGVSTEANPYLSYRETTLVTNTNSNTVGNGVSKPSLVFLDTNCANQVLRPGDILECTVHWKNVSSKNLTNVLLRVGFPEELQFQKATSGNFSAVDNAVVVEIGNLFPQQEGSMTFTTMVKTNVELGKIIVVASNLVYSYTGDNGAFNQEEVFSYSDHVIQNNDGSVLAGAAIFGNGFLPNTLVGWLLLLLVILLILVAARMTYNSVKPRIVTVPGNGGMH